MNGTGFNPGEQLPPGKYRAASELLVRDRVFVNLIIERGPGGGYALFGQEQSGIFDVHAVCFDGLVLAPEIGEFRKNCGHLVGDDFAQLRGGGYDNWIVHTLTLLTV